MKVFVGIVLILSSSFASAAVVCPKRSDTVVTCRSTPEEGDHPLAIQILNSIVICKTPRKLIAISDSQGTEIQNEVQAVSRLRGTTYILASNPQQEFSLTVAAGPFAPQYRGVFIVNFRAPQITAASNFTCTRGNL